MTVPFDEDRTVRFTLTRTVPPLSDDPLEAMGQVLAESIKQGRRVDLLANSVDGLGAKVDGFERTLAAALAELKKERPELVHQASTRAATHTSNRLAALLGALALLYTEAAPVLHELWRSLHR